jgi:predicted CoA-binding protein
VFRRAEEVPAIAHSAITIGANVLWMQLGVINEEAARIAREAGLEVVMDRCVKIEHARFFGGLNLVGMNTGVITARRQIG